MTLVFSVSNFSRIQHRQLLLRFFLFNFFSSNFDRGPGLRLRNLPCTPPPFYVLFVATLLLELWSGGLLFWPYYRKNVIFTFLRQEKWGTVEPLQRMVNAHWVFN